MSHDHIHSVHDAYVHDDHDHDHDDDHDHEDVDGALEDNPIWQRDNVELISVGVDVGSSGTQVAFSRLLLRRMGEALTSRYVVVERESLYESDVTFTPYAGETLIDAAALGAIVGGAYDAARITPAQVDTGVVILTGEALRAQNAEPITRVLAGTAGDLVCASAGHHMEARLAAYGSGSVFTSFEEGSRLLNIDIGGGTTKLALVEAGRIVATAALLVGGRHHVVGPAGRIERITSTGRQQAAELGLEWTVGTAVADGDLDRLADALADALVAAVTPGRPAARLRAPLLTDSLDNATDLDGVTFSGGVAEYVYGRQTRDFGDLGRRLGQALRQRIDEGQFPAPLRPVAEGIRATVVGAAQHNVQLSGATTFIRDPGRVLPRRNLRVLRPAYCATADLDADAVAQAIGLELSTVDDPTDDVVLALEWSGPPEYARLAALARGIADAVAVRTAEGRALYIAFDADIARTVGHLLTDDLGVGGDVVIIDGIRLGDLDYIDLGALREPSGTVPVTIKSLVFSAGR